MLLDFIIKEVKKEWGYKESVAFEKSDTQVETLLWCPSCTCTACIYTIDMRQTMSHCSGGIWSRAHAQQTCLRCSEVSGMHQLGMGIAVLHCPASCTLWLCWAALASEVAQQACIWPLSGAAVLDEFRQCRIVHGKTSMTLGGDVGI